MAQIIVFLTVTIPGIVWNNRLLILTVVFLVGFFANLVGEHLRKKGLTLAIEQGTDTEAEAAGFPYKSVGLSLVIVGMFLMALAAILLYFAGAYDYALQKMGLEAWMSR